ncbi:MAG: PsiF family protein [Rhodocyclaceae bacterium]|nr:PsiF family protein [Rhodocyclaceae bacterium]
MKKLLAVLATTVLAGQFAFAPAAFAADDKKPTPQQQRMKDCNAEAKGMKGQERKDFMKGCLSGRQAENKAAREERRAENQAARQTQQDKMKTCNADAKTKGLTGDARKAFMSDCLKN